jgi:alkylhydroperoxidase family enzyme
MSGRVEALHPDDLTEAQRELYDLLLEGPRAKGPRPFPLTDGQGRLRGPFNAMLLNPELGRVLQELGAVVRYRTGFTERQREIAILAVAAHEDSAYEWAIHSHFGRRLGLTADDLDALRSGTGTPFEDPAETAVLTATRELARSGDLDDESFHATAGAIGLTRLYELVTLVGYYRLLAGQLRVLRVSE